MFQGIFKGVLGHFKGVSRMFQWCFEDVSSVSGKLHGDFKKVTKKIEG